MGANFEHIDGVFKSKLKDFSQAAPEGLWSEIESSLDSHKKISKYKFYRIAAAIAAFALVGSVYLYFNNSRVQIDSEMMAEQETPVVKASNELEQKQLGAQTADLTTNQEALKEENSTHELNIVAQSLELDHKSQEFIPKTTSEVKSEENKQRSLNEINRIESKEVVLHYEYAEPVLVDVRKKKIESILKSLPDINSIYAANNVDIQEVKQSKWSVGGEFTPLYSYRHITETDGDYSKAYYNNSENAIMSYTGGVNVQYTAIERLTIQAGVYYTTMGQSFDYMDVYANAAYDMVADEFKDRFINSYNITNSLGTVSFNTAYVVHDEKLGRVDNLTDSKGAINVSDPMYSNIEAEIQQNFQYIEVPFLLRYKLLDKNIDLNLIGGVGANFLIGNDVYLKYSGNKEIIGETAGVNSVNYNGTIGLGLEYPLMKKLNLRLEPSIKYYINEINSSSSIESHPYSVGIYTGICYSF